MLVADFERERDFVREWKIFFWCRLGRKRLSEKVNGDERRQGSDLSERKIIKIRCTKMHGYYYTYSQRFNIDSRIVFHWSIFILFPIAAAPIFII